MVITVREAVLSLGSGVLFGAALDKASTNKPWVVSKQMEMDNMVMLRMFLAASATSTAVAAVLNALGWRVRDVRTSVALGLGLMGGYGGNVVGGLLLGAGMYLSGSCPGTIWSQLALAGTHKLALVGGAVAGSLAFGYVVEPHMRCSYPTWQKRGSGEAADVVPRSVRFELAAASYVAAVAAVLYGVDQLFPWHDEMAKVLQGFAPTRDGAWPGLSDQAWDPAFSGILVGLLQAPMHFTQAGLLGMSSAWALIGAHVASALDGAVDTHAPYFAKAKSNSAGLLQLLIGLGVFAGTLAAQHLGGYPALTRAAVEGASVGGRGPLGQALTFLGAAFLTLGARIMMGCTSGHLSGWSSLSLASLVSIVAMFAGGMSAGFFNKLVLGNA
jgi:hypothetical protein